MNSPQEASAQSCYRDHNSKKKFAQDLTHELKDYMNCFELSHENGSKKLCFKCKICEVPLPSKNTRLHIFSRKHMETFRKSVCVVRGSFYWSVKPNLNEVISKFSSKLYFFELIYDMISNEIYFICKVCTAVLLIEDVKNHIYSTEHSENVLANPVVLLYDSLDVSNQQIIKELGAAIKSKIGDFAFVYRIGTEELLFYCKYCQITLIPKNVEDHVKASHHLKAVSAQSTQNLNTSDKSNSKKQNYKSTPQNNVKMPSETPLEALNQNPILFDSLTDKVKEIIQSFKNDVNLKFFDLLHSADSNTFFFKCKLCDVTLKPSHVTNHIQVGYHVKNMTISSQFKHFQSIKESSKEIVRKLFYEIGDALNDFILLPDIGNEKPLFHCKLCDGTLSSDFIVDHLKTILHQQSSKKNKSRNHSAANLKTSSEPFESNCFQTEEHQKRAKKNKNATFKSHKIGRNMTPASSSASLNSCESMPDTYFAVGDSIGEGLRKNSNEPPKSGVKHRTHSNGNCFVCQDCSTVIQLETLENSRQKMIQKETIERIFVKCCGKSVETAILDARNRKISKSNSTASGNSLESDVDLSESNKEILKILIDKIGIKIDHFDFVLKNSADELRFKCKFCSVMMRPETAESHLSSKEHVKYLQLSKVSNLRFDVLNDSDKKQVRKLFNNIGSEINDFDVAVSFVCKICGANVNLETAANHLQSEEHLKHLFGHGSLVGLAADMSDVQSNLECNNDFDNFKEMATAAFSNNNDHHFVPSQNVNPKLNKTDNGVSERMTIVATIVADTNLTPTAAAEKLLVDRKVSRTVSPPLSAENNHHQKIQENPGASFSDKYAATVNSNKPSRVSESSSHDADFMSSARDQSCVHLSSTDELLLSPKLSFAQTSESETGSKLVPELVTSDSCQFFSCAVCRKDISLKDRKNHVNCEFHAVSLGMSDIINFSCFHDYYREIVKMFTGDFSDDNHKLDIFYKLPKYKLNFYCKLCYVIISPEFLAEHVNHEHLNTFPERFERFAIDSETDFVCEPCQDYVYFKDMATHVGSKAHVESLLISRNALEFNCFNGYKDRVVKTLVYPAKSVETSDFELFLEINSPKLHVYCKACELLLCPEFLDAHVGLQQHDLNSHKLAQWDRSYGPYHPSFDASKEELSNKSTDSCCVM